METEACAEERAESSGLLPKDAPPEGYVPRRHIVKFFLFLAGAVVYAVRTTLSVAIIPMGEEYGWSDTDKGVVLGAFFNGYIILIFVGGWLANVWSAKWVIFWAVVLSTFFQTITPFMARISITAVIVVQFLAGLFQGPVFPSISQLTAVWVPEYERMLTAVASGVGASLGWIMSVFTTMWLLNEKYGWDLSFYVMAAFAAVFCVIWAVFQTDWPAHASMLAIHPSEVELIGSHKYISESVDVPVQLVLSSCCVYATIVCQICFGWVFFAFFAWAPSLLVLELGFSYMEAAALAAFVSIGGMVVLFITSVVSDCLVGRGYSLTAVRKTTQLFSTFFACGCWLYASIIFSHGDRTEIALFLTLAICVQMMTGCGHENNHLDIAPRFAGFLDGMFESASTLAGVASIPVTGVLLDAGFGWAWICQLFAALLAFGSGCFIAFGRCDVVFE
eukprot:gnl/Spiro4/18738_TR10015_c0_g1_i1.p1 gnl/Spiro4/18738_TR10015_c0_g1~~gnl/Spiro4/18738_TR10015_c0_g1_i1.p1  ORF type:complete len:447 (-),score=65.53 gnl/Spiro4/18738_TR10015_c0_g1_i1:44-1384(-)